MSKTVILVCAHKQDAPQNPALPARSGRTGHFINGTSVRRRRRHGRQHQRPQPPLTANSRPTTSSGKPADADYRVEPLSPLFRLRGGSACSCGRSLGSLLLGIASGPRLRPPFQPAAISSAEARPKIYPYNLYTDYGKCHIEATC